MWMTTWVEQSIHVTLFWCPNKHLGSVFTCTRKNTLSCFSWNICPFNILILLNGDNQEKIAFYQVKIRKCQCRCTNLQVVPGDHGKCMRRAASSPGLPGVQRNLVFMWNFQVLATNFKCVPCGGSNQTPVINFCYRIALETSFRVQPFTHKPGWKVSAETSAFPPATTSWHQTSTISAAYLNG